MFQRSLLPFDGSDASRWVLRRAKDLLHKPGVTVKLMQVVRRAETGSRDAPDRSDLRAYATLLAERHQLRWDLGIAAEAETRFGDPAEEILREADRGRHDLLLMATHTHPGPDLRFFGSVALRVVQASNVCLLLFRPLLRPNGTVSPAAATVPARFSRILVPLDGSRVAEEVFPAAESLARMFDSKLYLYSSEGLSGVIDAGEPGRTVEYLSNRCKAAEEAGLKAESYFRPGVAAKGVLGTIEEGTVDTVALTTQERTRVANASYDTMAGAILTRGGVPMLVQRNPSPGLERMTPKSRTDPSH